MSLSLLLVTTGLAATSVWLNSPPDPARTPGFSAISAEAAVGDHAWGPEDERAINALRTELAAARPLADVFDGELQIMQRLQAALDAIEVIRAEDRDLVWEALVFQGFAVHRYFQGALDTDPAAAAWRVREAGRAEAGRAEVGPWVDAVALNPDRAPTLAELPGEAELAAWVEQRARHLLVEPASVVAADLPANGRLVVDGKEMATDRARVPAGYHRITLTIDGVVRRRVQGRLEPDGKLLVAMPATAQEIAELATPLGQAPPELRLGGPVQVVLTALPQPVQLVVETRRETLIYDVQGDLAVLQRSAQATGGGDATGWRAWVGLGAGWINDGEYFLSNLPDDPPYERGTVNAAGPVVSVGFDVRPTRLLALGAGVDLLTPLGEHHALPVGERDLRLRATPHLSVGLPWLAVGVGAQLPWRVGVGPRLHAPLGEHLELSGAYTYGIGLTRAREDGAPDFEPVDTHSAWLGLSYVLGR